MRHKGLAGSRLGKRRLRTRCKITTRSSTLMPSPTPTAPGARGEATVFATGETTVIAAGKTTRSRRPAVVAGTALDALAVIETTAESTTIATAEAATVGTARRTAELAIA